jgi:integrase/recombinase XerD
VKTAQAKRADLSRFVGFYLEVAGDDIRPWSPGVTASFLEELSREVSPVNGRRYQSSTLERILATVRHFGRWVDQRGGLPGGEPCQGVVVPPGGPLARAKVVWGEEEILRLREAAVALCQRESAAKLPWRDRVVLELLLLGFRPGEVGILRKSQLRSGGIPWKLVWVVRRGKKEPVEMALSPEAAAAMEDYFREVRGRGPGLLLRSRQGRPLATRDVERGMERVLERVNWGRQRRR